MIELLRQIGFVPRGCVWELTLTCNLRCLHCGSYAGASRQDELSLEELFDVAEQLVALGCDRVTLSGGEPTLHPHWHEVARKLVDLGAKVNIISNALVFTDNHLKLAKEAGLSNVAFSLDGFEEEHDQFRREGSFARVLEATRRCLDGGLPVAINTTVNNLNKHILPELRDFLGELGIFSWQIQVATPSGNLSEHRELVIQPEDMLWLVPQIAKMRLQRDITPSVNPGDDIGYYGKCEKAIRDSGADISFWIGCRAGCQVIGIESNGNIKGCLSLPSSMHGEDKFVEGNIRNGRLADIWNRPGGFAYNRDFTEDQLGGFCAVCRYRTFCRGGCTWTAFSHTKNRYDNPYCLHQQAVKHRRFDLLEEEPLEAELAFFAQPEKKARKANR